MRITPVPPSGYMRTLAASPTSTASPSKRLSASEAATENKQLQLEVVRLRQLIAKMTKVAKKSLPNRVGQFESTAPVASSTDLALNLSANFRVYEGRVLDASVNPDETFTGTSTASSSASVNPGSFYGNGIEIKVNKSDSFNTVLSAINALNTGYLGAYDADSQRIRFAESTSGSGAQLELALDSSGFLAAAGLDDLTLGQVIASEADELITNVQALADVQSGSFSINGTSISVDVGSDRLSDVIDRINSAGAGVTAALDSETGQISFQSVGVGVMDLQDGTANFFTALGVNAGIYDPDAAADEARVKGRRGRAANLEAGFTKMDKLLSQIVKRLDRIGTGTASTYKKNLLESLSKSFSGSSRVRTSAFGLRLDTEATEGNVIDLNKRKLFSEMVKRPKGVQRFLTGDGTAANSRGMLGKMDVALAGVEASLERINGRTGLLVNAMA